MAEFPGLTADWLRQRFALAPAASEAAEPFSPDGDQSGAPATALTPAAVLVPIVLRETGLTVLLTQRTGHLRDHPNQVSFPGGRREPGDLSPVHTALREAEEEVGLAPSQIEVLGDLAEYRTGTGFTITPVVALVHPPLNLKLDDFEVAEVFEPPLAFLLDTANHERHSIEYQGRQREYYAMPWEGYYIWGATAGMLIALRRRLLPGA